MKNRIVTATIAIKDATFLDKNLDWSLPALDEQAVKRYNETYGTSFVCGQLSKADKIEIKIAKNGVTLNSELRFLPTGEVLLRETLMTGFYGSLVNGTPFKSDIHKVVRQALEKALSQVDWDNIGFEKITQFEIKFELPTT